MAVPDVGSSERGGLWLRLSPSWGRRGPLSLAMAAPPKGARPGHSCGSEPGVCPDNPSPGAVCS